MVKVMHMRTEGQTRQGTGGDHPLHHDGIIGDLCTAARAEMDGEVDWGCCLHIDTPSVLPSRFQRPSCVAFGSFDPAEQNDHDAAEQDDQVLDWWLASLTSDDFERIFDSLANLKNGQHSGLEPIA
jgi:hypothetical protein